MNWVEWIGILGTLLIIVGWAFSDMKKARNFNILGCIAFIIYGVMIHSISVWLLNGACIVLQFFKLYKESKENKNKSQNQE